MFRHIQGRSVTFAVTEARVLSLYLRTTNTQAYAEPNAGDCNVTVLSYQKYGQNKQPFCRALA